MDGGTNRHGEILKLGDLKAGERCQVLIKDETYYVNPKVKVTKMGHRHAEKWEITGENGVGQTQVRHAMGALPYNRAISSLTCDTGDGKVEAVMITANSGYYDANVWLFGKVVEVLEGGRKIKKLDDHVIAVVFNGPFGWHIKEIIYGQWDVRETALRIVKAYRDYRPVGLGIEKGMAMNAVLPYLMDEQNRLGTYFEVTPLSHGNQKKEDRIQWALQGRAEKGRISLARGDWNKAFLDQAVDFPSPLSHDDLIDAVAYIDQIATPWFEGPDMIDDWEPIDEIAGY